MLNLISESREKVKNDQKFTNDDGQKQKMTQVN